MNKEHLEQIFQHYLGKFDYMNVHPSTEWYKWKIAKEFPAAMDRALAAPVHAFPAALLDAQKLTENLIDNFTQPFYGLCQFAKQEPEEVRSMFRDLYAGDGNDMAAKLEKVETFMERSLRLRDTYSPESFLYKTDLHAVTGFLFLYDPDHNYIYKYSHARKFADCIEFYEDWGRGGATNLATYYRMCDELVEALKENASFLAERQKLVERLNIQSEELHPDTEKHILAFDIIYCCAAYGLYDGIAIRPRLSKSHSGKPVVDLAALKEKFQKAAQKEKERQEAEAYVAEIMHPGVKIQHKKYGKGIIKSESRTGVVVDFPGVGEKEIGLKFAVANGVIEALDVPDGSQHIEKIRDILKNGDAIRAMYQACSKEIEPYREELE